MQMTSDSHKESLGKLRSRAIQSLQSFARNRQAVALMSLRMDSRDLRRSTGSGDQGVLPSDGAGASTRRVATDEERQLRAMAKDIKRLIVEDRRRGLSIGG